jgi:hypothetical protein
MDFVSAASLEIDGCRILLASIYLPCHSKGDGAFSAAIAEIDSLLEDRWVAAPWSFLVFGGDANTEVPSQPHFGPACTGGAWSARSEALAKFVAKWNGAWTSTFNNDACSYTHLHHVHKSTRVIDYIWCSTCSGTDFHATTHVAYQLCIKSDHYPIMVDITLKHGGSRKVPRRKIPWKPKCNFADVRVQNRFAALMDHAVYSDEGQDLSVFSSNIRTAMDFSQNFEAPVSVSVGHSIRDQLGPLYLAVDVAPDAVSRQQAIKTLNGHKKVIKRAKATNQFLSCALRAPRDDKNTKSGIKPLFVDGNLSFCAADWEKEFRALYVGLYDDPHNSLDVQNDRLEHLRSLMSCEDRIIVPEFLVYEILAQGRRKSKTAPGIDLISWGALACLPPRAVSRLVALIELRINGDSGHGHIMNEWCSIVVNLIPKINNPSLSKHWRPIALTSCLQKLYLSVVARLLQYFCSPPLANQLGFTQGKQCAELSEFVRLALQKSSQWGIDLYVLKLDVFRAFDAMRHDTILGSLIDCQCPVKLQHAVMCELAHGTISLKFQGES